MKKFWNLMLAALVIFGAVACTEKEVAPEQNAGMSFTATIDLDETRTDVVFNETEKVWETVWTGNETLMVLPKSGIPIPCYFTNTPSNPNKFTCADASSVVGKSVKIQLVQAHESNMDSKAGKAGGSLYAEVDNFTADSNVTLSVGTAFLRYSSASQVTLSTAGSYIFDYSGNTHDSITLPAGEDVWVAVKPGTVNLSYSIDGDVVKTKEDLTIEAKKIYNLGTLAKPEPEPEMTTVYLVPGAWANDNAHFAVLYWIGENNTDLLMTKHATKDGVYEVKVAANADGLLFKRLDPETHQVWNQTVDLKLPTEADKNYFYFESWGTQETTEGKSTGRWDVDPFAPETPDQASKWCVSGAFCSWSDAGTGMVTTTVKNLFVAKNITLAAYGEFKIKLKTAWDGSIGAGDINYINKNSKVVGYVGSNTNFSAVEAGKYDIYFDALTNNVYLMVAGTDYSTAATQDKNGPMPNMLGVTWGLCGAHNNWGSASVDTVLAWDDTIGLFVAKSVKFTGEFKVRANNDWGTNFGSGATITVNKAAATTVYNNGGNCKIASGTYDVYFWYDTTNIKANGKIWVKTAGSAAPSL